MELIHKEKVTAACGCQACVNANDPLICSVYRNKVVYFCTDKCKQSFDENPEAFLKSSHFKISLEMLDDAKYVENE